MERLTLRQLRIFEAVATANSFADAAQRLGLTQPAVSMQLQELQRAFGVSLFRPGRGRLRTLSDTGAALLQQARAILAQVREAEEILGARDGESRGLLHLAVVPTANYFAPWLLTAFRTLNPDVTLKLTVGSREEVLAMLADRRVDLAISGYPAAEADIEATSFAKHPHCVVAASGNPLARRRNLTWQDLRDEPFIFREPGSATRRFFEHLLVAQSIPVRAAIELAGNETVKQAVMAGMGISFMSAHSVQVELAARRIAILDLEGMPKQLDWCLLHRRETPLAGVNALFHAFVRSQGARLCACRSVFTARRHVTGA